MVILSRAEYLVAVVRWFVRSFFADSQVSCLLVWKCGHLNSEVAQMQPGDFLIKLTRQKEFKKVKKKKLK